MTCVTEVTLFLGLYYYYYYLSKGHKGEEEKARASVSGMVALWWRGSKWGEGIVRKCLHLDEQSFVVRT